MEPKLNVGLPSPQLADMPRDCPPTVPIIAKSSGWPNLPSRTETADEQDPDRRSGSSWADLFVFNTPRQLGVMPCALATACASAAGKAVYTIMLGKIFDVISGFGAGTIDGNDALSQVSRWCAYLCALGVAFWLFNGLDMLLWMISGELRAKSARMTLFSSLLRKEMSWYDSRQDGITSLVIRIQT